VLIHTSPASNWCQLTIQLLDQVKLLRALEAESAFWGCPTGVRAIPEEGREREDGSSFI